MINYDYLTLLKNSNVPEDKIADCMAWAFGDGWQAQFRSMMDNLWNERHGQIVTIGGGDSIVDAFQKIATAYKETKLGKNKEFEVEPQAATDETASKLVEAGCPDNKLLSCFEWAFGPGWSGIKKTAVPAIWNERHGNIFKIETEQVTNEDYVRIGQAYKNFVLGLKGKP